MCYNVGEDICAICTKYIEKWGYSVSQTAQKALTERERQFCILVVDGYSLTDAYIKAGYKEATKRITTGSKACVLSKKPRVAAELERLKAARDQAIAERAAESGRALTKIWTREKAARSLAELAALGMRSARRIKIDADGQEVETVDEKAARVAIDAIDSLNKMCGYDKAVIGEDAQTITVQLGEAEAYAK